MPPVTDQLRIGIIGVNGIGQAHLWSLRQSERSCAAAVCDIDEPRAEKAGADFDVPAFADLGAMLASGTVDAVVVATPAGTHGQIARDALDAGMHVYCEKPIAPDCRRGIRTRTTRARSPAHAAGRLPVPVPQGLRRDTRGRGTIAPLSARQPQRDELVPRAALLRRQPVARVVGNGRWRRADEPGDPPTRRDRLDRGTPSARARPSADARVTAPRSRTTRSRCSNGNRVPPECSSRRSRIPPGTNASSCSATSARCDSRTATTSASREHDDAQRLSDECEDEFPELTHEWRSRRHRAGGAASGSTASSTRIATSPARCSTAARRSSTAKRAHAPSNSRTPSISRRSRIAVVELPLERGEYTPWYEELVAGSLTI